MMKQHDFAKGMTMGVAMGTALGFAIAPKKKHAVQKAANRAMHTVGKAMEDLSQEMGLR